MAYGHFDPKPAPLWPQVIAVLYAKGVDVRKLIVGLFIYLIASLPVFAGYYGDSRVDEYDPTTGIYYKAVVIERESRGFISKGPSTQVANISIFIPNTENHTLLFKDNKKRNISMVL